MIEGYKFFLKDYKAKYGDFQFKVGERYKHDGPVMMQIEMFGTGR